MTVHVTFRSGETAVFDVPKSILAEDFRELAALVDDSGIRTFRAS